MRRKRRTREEIDIQKEQAARLKEPDARRIFYDMNVKRMLEAGKSIEDISKTLNKTELWVKARIIDIKEETE